MNHEEQRAILKKLKEPFAPEDHEERVLKGGGKWFFVRWQKIRERLDEACPDWEVEYSDPIYIDAYCVIRCTLTIAGIKRTAPGNGEVANKRGTPIENATADAFKNACEAFGVARYLDEQSKEAREFTIRYLHSKGDARGQKRAVENGYINGNLKTPTIVKKEQPAQILSSAEGSKLWNAAKAIGHTQETAKAVLQTFNVASFREIPIELSEKIEAAFVTSGLRQAAPALD